MGSCALLLAGLCVVGCASAPLAAPDGSGYEVVIFHYGKLYLDFELTHQQVIAQLSSPERPDAFFVIRPVDIETYVWNPQRITLTRGGTQRLRAAVEQVYEEDFPLDTGLRGRYFMVRVDGDAVYGGKISEDFSPPANVRFPAMLVEEIDGRLVLHILPIEMYEGLDPRLEDSIRCASLPLYDDEERAANDADPEVQSFRRILRDPRIEAVFARQGKLVPESPPTPEQLYLESLDRLMTANRDVDFEHARDGAFDLWAVLTLELELTGDRGTMVSLVSRQSNASGADEAVTFRREYRQVGKEWRLDSEEEERCPQAGLCWPPSGKAHQQPAGAEDVLTASAELERIVASGDEVALDHLLEGECEEAGNRLRDPWDRLKWVERDDIKSALLGGRVTELGREIAIDGNRATVRALVDLAGATDPKAPRTWGIVSERELIRTDLGWRLCRVRWETATCLFSGSRGPWASLSGCPYREISVNPCWPPAWQDPSRPPGCTRYYYHRSDIFDGAQQGWRCGS